MGNMYRFFALLEEEYTMVLGIKLLSAGKWGVQSTRFIHVTLH